MHELRSSSCTGMVQSGVYSHLRPNDFHFLSWLFCVCRVLRLLGICDFNVSILCIVCIGVVMFH